MCLRAQKRRKREGTLKLESNPVYATYQADYDPVAEVIVNQYLCACIPVFVKLQSIIRPGGSVDAAPAHAVAALTNFFK